MCGVQNNKPNNVRKKVVTLHSKYSRSLKQTNNDMGFVDYVTDRVGPTSVSTYFLVNELIFHSIRTVRTGFRGTRQNCLY